MTLSHRRPAAGAPRVAIATIATLALILFPTLARERPSSRRAAGPLRGDGPRDLRRGSERSGLRHQRCRPGGRDRAHPRVPLAERRDDRPGHPRREFQRGRGHQRLRPGRRWRHHGPSLDGPRRSLGQRRDNQPHARPGQFGQRDQRFGPGDRHPQRHLDGLPLGQRRDHRPGPPRQRGHQRHGHQQCRASGRLVVFHRSHRRTGPCRTRSSGRTA